MVNKKKINFLVSPYCSWLFSRKEIIRFSEVTVVSVHSNFLIDWIVIVPVYCPWNTANAPVNVSLLVKLAIKWPKENLKFVQTFFIIHLAALRLTLGNWQWSSLTHLMLNTRLFQVRPEFYQGSRNEVGPESLTKLISGIRTGNLPILSVTCYPTVWLSLKVYQKQLTIVLIISLRGIIGLFH